MFVRSAVALVAAGALLACDAGEGTPRPDRSGRPIGVERPVRRIVSLSPPLTELLFQIGAGERVVGRTHWGTQPPEAADVPSIGDGLDPNLETILARAPELVVLYHTPANASTIERLRAVGVPTLSVPMDQLEHVSEAARLLGEVLGGLPRADSLADAYDRDLAALRTGAPALPDTLAILMLAWDAPPIVIGGGSFLSEIVRLAGARNVFADISAPSATVSLESIAARDPDLLLIIGETEPAVLDRPEWRAIPAVRDRRLVSVQGTAYAWPSPRSLDVVRALADTFRGVTR
jgi:ABC-type Fe3+-hydroxamate transport system substrate-binding protein